MEDEKVRVENLEEVLAEKRRIEMELARKSLESYKLRRIAEEGLTPKHLDFLRGDSEEEFERSLKAYLDERAAAKESAKKELLLKSFLVEPTKTSAPQTVSEEELVKEEILRFSGQKIT